ncbi:hypothetical protein FPQ18DRAFT_300756 [Pyronema domesticum]|nr:hypothetical protein FPQ18DRAFT_300756 [Pyronema domesticum]
MSIPWLHKGVAKHTVMESKPILGLSPPTNESSAGVGSETRTVVLPSQPILVRCFTNYEGYSVDNIHEISRIDKWFLYKLEKIVEMYKKLQDLGSLCATGGTRIRNTPQKSPTLGLWDRNQAVKKGWCVEAGRSWLLELFWTDGRWEGLLKWAEEFQKNFQSFGYDAIR